jgi:hypothetical protein
VQLFPAIVFVSSWRLSITGMTKTATLLSPFGETRERCIAFPPVLSFIHPALSSPDIFFPA